MTDANVLKLLADAGLGGSMGEEAYQLGYDAGLENARNSRISQPNTMMPLEPVEVTPLTPEPQDEGIYLLFDGSNPVDSMIRDSTVNQSHWLYDDRWMDWKTILISLNFGGADHIQSLVAHDAQIRAKAWDEGLKSTGAILDDSSNPYRREQK
ncbi:hypothetical protein [Bifidobacterium aquikefiri]|uniref:hypothetical protein n=1 Tax=Bifidobacterium aquikefiri TaxID=1653207 RepID=UPI0039ECA64E